ncbi:MAG: NADH-quinone oxidoreductase subunit N [bacterium]
MNGQFSAFAYAGFPLLVMTGTALLVLIVGLFTRHRAQWVLLLLSLAGIGVSFAASFLFWKNKLFAMTGMITVDPFACFLYTVLLLIGFLVCLNHYVYFEKQKIDYPEIYSLTLFALSGMMLMVSTTHLLLFFLGLEVMSLAIYVLVGIRRADWRSNEGAMKYFILGAMVAGFLLYGTALIYGTTGQLDMRNIAPNLLKSDDMKLFQIGALLVVVSFSFKIAAVPFHFWTPDVYEGAPISVTGLMATGVKAAAFGALLRITLPLLPFTDLRLGTLVQGLSIATMIVGNLVALYQTNLKRMLAYSSIAHAGYILVGVSAAFAGGKFHGDALGAPLFYLFAYAAMTVGAFAVASAIAGEREDRGEDSYYVGLAARSPKLAAAMAVFMLALTGIPPTVGFAGKFYLFREAMHQQLYGLVVVGVLMSAVSAYYYLRVVVNMYFGKKSEVPHRAQGTVVVKPLLAFVILFCIATTLYVGLAPTRYLQLSALSRIISR